MDKRIPGGASGSGAIRMEVTFRLKMMLVECMVSAT
jgi:hypothetical protein